MLILVGWYVVGGGIIFYSFLLLNRRLLFRHLGAWLLLGGRST
jgi:hypothetical protein